MTPDMHRQSRSTVHAIARGGAGPRARTEQVEPLALADELGSELEARCGRLIAAPVDVIFDAWTDLAIRRLWLGSARLRIRRAVPYRLLTLLRDDGSRIDVQFFPRGPDRALVRLSHRQLRGRAGVARSKWFWEEKLARLKVLLEGV